MRLPSSLAILTGLVLGALTLTLIPADALFVDSSHAGHNHPHDHTSATAAEPGARYACPMMDFIGDKPGDCPVCGMKMTKVTAGELTREQTRRLGLETSVVTTGPAVATVRAHGLADYDHRFTEVVIPRLPGRIVKRHAATFTDRAPIAVGAPLVDLYSEPVIAAQAELRSALQLNDTALVAALRARFERWNLATVADAIARGEPVRDIVTITSPFAGQVLLADEESVNTDLAVGRELAADTPLLRIVNPDKLVLVVQVPETRARWIVAGQPVLLASDDAGPLPQINASVGRVAPEINPMLRAREVRIHLDNARPHLAPGSLVEARLQVALAPDLTPADPHDRSTWGEFILVPKTAVLSTGIRHVAWKISTRDSSGRTHFTLAPLALGPRLEDENGNDLYVVRAGLSAGDEVATQGAFLIDSQSQLAGTPSLLFPTGTP